MVRAAVSMFARLARALDGVVRGALRRAARVLRA